MTSINDFYLPNFTFEIIPFNTFLKFFSYSYMIFKQNIYPITLSILKNQYYIMYYFFYNCKIFITNGLASSSKR